MKSWIFIIIPLVANCTFISNKPTSLSSVSNVEENRVIYNDSASYETVVINKYNDLNQLVNETSLSPIKRGIYLDTMRAFTEFKYQNDNVVYKIRISGFRPDTLESYFNYDKENRLMSEMMVENSVDTTKIVSYDYVQEKNMKITKSISFEKSPYEREKSNIPFDTLFSLTKAYYMDTLELRKEMFIGKSWSLLNLDKTWTMTYDDKNRKIATTTLNSHGDTVLIFNHIYNNEIVVRTESFGENYSTIGMYDENGIIQYMLTSENKEPYDTSFYYNDNKGNVTKIIYRFK